jgi:hypothetical protein
LKVWGFRSGIDKTISPLYLADDCNLIAESSDNNVEKGIFVWELFYINGELAYGARTKFLRAKQIISLEKNV